ncbi:MULTISPECIES: bifunctional precorrin-2 dehydrogenase/sirohydrochlorin ferrochelatase [unclassified Paenibacillus]|uniref:precorrin-2 dehydrogenase/sirohydrochlorin ferrochelatase family protein n=1 Tax=unclassified Paenibacillus TaxID=185978 RepID=UPI000955FEAC|nr:MULTISPECIES: bifunctional precorrin-2 dehydrogenase/sirohydrochlorin ferrochelatase [unclassified Paenibacillus]ASS66345.2 bifunctional precorrin-2 dehydrogenase/sirohydrochlorin ferrochelatase [Paenibacillus sp. RUD330]SIQ07152.1 precorrin-2 dehydrogenase / sirohydrochlorin ferrochelatase [Paenibacillus sp. RU4X]SIQ27213.1 precorrin-2 dehydrogenase / sirohydrochlorin ferrochelatase [Paenibacillus sp. RU4T]
MPGYPVVLRLEGKSCLIVGGGAAAERKAAGLLDGGADRLVVVSPAVTAGIRAWAGQGRLKHLERVYRPGDAAGMFLVVAATGAVEVDSAVMEDAGAAGALFNHASSGQSGDFMTAGAVRRGGLLLAVTTGGGSPALSSVIREELEDLYKEPYAEAVRQHAALRRRLLAEEPNPGKRRRLLRSEAERLASRAAAASRGLEDHARFGAEGEGDIENR